MAPRTRAQRKRAREEEDEKRCRVCLEGECDGPLVQPCACRGSAKFIHKACLEHWRRTSPKQDAAYRCGECMDEYRDALSLELLSARLQAKRTSGQNTLFTLNALAAELHDQGKFDEAEPLLREALEMSRKILGNRHQITLASINNLGMVLKDKGDLATAELLYREALEVQRETLGNRHPGTLCTISNLGVLLQAKGDFASAELLHREGLDGSRETLGNRHPDTLGSINNLGTLFSKKGDDAEPLHRRELYHEAYVLYREALDGRLETLGNRHPETRKSIGNLRTLLLKLFKVLQAKGGHLLRSSGDGPDKT